MYEKHVQFDCSVLQRTTEMNYNAKHIRGGQQTRCEKEKKIRRKITAPTRTTTTTMTNGPECCISAKSRKHSRLK